MNTDRIISARLSKLDAETLTKARREIATSKKMICHRVTESDIKSASGGDTQKTIKFDNRLYLRSWKTEHPCKRGYDRRRHMAKAHLNVNQDLKQRGRLTAMMIDDLTQRLHLIKRERRQTVRFKAHHVDPPVQ
jgi:hypothetical protein